jgi:hypothetical protein
MGSETEYALAIRNGARRINAEECVHQLVEATAREFPSLPDSRNGVSYFHGNGSRTYREIGAKLEHATPECFSPVELARYDKAGERILARVAARLQAHQPGVEIAIFKNNVGGISPDCSTWGTHESYTCWTGLECAIGPMLGHLVSRIYYASAGILAHHEQGIGFELSQRARHMVRVSGPETTGLRAVFCTRIRKQSDFSSQGWVRAHLICKDSQRSAFAIYLTIGTTALLFHLLNNGRSIGGKLAPRNPVEAFRTLSLDPWRQARIELVDGRKLSGIEIQFEYLDACERAVQGGHGPEWAPELIRHWRETLEALAQDPLALADRLDTACKLKIIDHQLRRANYGWSDLNQGLRELSVLRKQFSARIVRAVLEEDPNELSSEERLQFNSARGGLRGERSRSIERLRFTAQLQALDLNYHALGGLYDSVESSGGIKHVVLERSDIDRAVQQPPERGRAAYRGKFIQQHQRQGWACDWMSLTHRASGQITHLDDPFADGPSGTSQPGCVDSGSHSTDPEPIVSDDDDPDILATTPASADYSIVSALFRRAFGTRIRDDRSERAHRRRSAGFASTESRDHRPSGSDALPPAPNDHIPEASDPDRTGSPC